MTLVKKQKSNVVYVARTDSADRQKCDKVCTNCHKGHSMWLHEQRTDSENQLTAAHGTFATVPYEMLLATESLGTISSEFCMRNDSIKAMIDEAERFEREDKIHLRDDQTLPKTTSDNHIMVIASEEQEEIRQVKEKKKN